jgi:hypothetical protein
MVYLLLSRWDKNYKILDKKCISFSLYLFHLNLEVTIFVLELIFYEKEEEE